MSELALVHEFKLPGDAGAWSIDWLPDGETLAVGDTKGVLRLMTPEGVERARLDTGNDKIWALSVSPDGRWIAASAEEHGLQVLAAAGLRRVAHWPQQWPNKPHWRADGALLAWDCEGDDSSDSDFCAMVVRVADWSLAARIADPQRHRGHGVALSPVSDQIAVALHGGGALIAETAGGTVIRRLQLSGKDLNDPAWSPTGDRLALAGDDTLALLGRDGGVIWQREQPSAAAPQWPAHDILVASLYREQRAVLLSPNDGHELASTPRQGGSVREFALSPDRQRLASTSNDGWVRVWDVSTYLRSPRRHAPQAGSLAEWAARHAATIGRRPPVSAAPAALAEARLPGADPATGLLGVLSNGEGRTDIDWAEPGRSIWALSEDGALWCWELTGGVATARIDLPALNERPILAVDPVSGALAVSCRLRKAATLLNAEGVELRRIETPTGIFSMAFSPRGSLLAIGENDGHVSIVGGDGRTLYRPHSYHGSCLTVAWSPDGTRIAANDDCELWHTGSSEHPKAAAPHTGTSFSIAWHPGSERVAKLRGGSGEIYIVDPNSGARREIIRRRGWPSRRRAQARLVARRALHRRRRRDPGGMDARGKTCCPLRAGCRSTGGVVVPLRYGADRWLLRWQGAAVGRALPRR